MLPPSLSSAVERKSSTRKSLQNMVGRRKRLPLFFSSFPPLALAVEQVGTYLKNAKHLPTTFCFLTASVVLMTKLSRATALCGGQIFKETTRWPMAP
jgi:hypothetical protein